MRRLLISIGADGGGTRTTAVAAGPDGKVLARATVGGLNWQNIGFDAARANMRRAVNVLLEKTGAAGVKRLAIGTAGLDGAASARDIRDFCGTAFDPEKLVLVSDATAALAGFAPKGPAALVICGTGSAAILRDRHGREHAIAGWGSVIGDYGGSSLLAREGLRAAMDARDGCGPRTALAGRDLRFFKVSNARRLAARVQTAAVSELAAFAKEVLALAQRGDTVAAAIVIRQVRALARTVSTELLRHPEVNRLALHGGVFRHSAFFRRAFTAELKRLVPDVSVELLKVPPEIGVLAI